MGNYFLENSSDEMDHDLCKFSTGEHGYPTVGQGRLDDGGFWEVPCYICARKYELKNPGEKCWPHTSKDIETLFLRKEKD